MTALVVDASVAAVWLLEDEDHPIAEAAYQYVESSDAIVPQIWQFEIRNILITSARRRRISIDDVESLLTVVDELGMSTDHEPDFHATMQLALTHNLTFYDALYLELAIRRDAQVATLDSDLVRAATAAGLSDPSRK